MFWQKQLQKWKAYFGSQVKSLVAGEEQGRQELEVAGPISFTQEAENDGCLGSVHFILFVQSLGQKQFLLILNLFHVSGPSHALVNVCKAFCLCDSTKD